VVGEDVAAVVAAEPPPLAELDEQRQPPQPQPQPLKILMRRRQ
jgi:hypothetical protein